MWIARHKSFVAGQILGTLAALLTARFAELFFQVPDNLVMRALYSVVQAIILPGGICAFLLGRSSGSFHLGLAVLVNFLLWFAFAWTVGALFGTLRKQWRTLMTQLPR
jgi:hypothetical protein